jgi:hypothetical protein
MPAAHPPAPGATRAEAPLPIVVVPVGPDDAALDACLAALDAATPAGTRVWLADDACGGPRVRAIVDAWLARTRLRAEYGRRPSPRGEVAHLDEVLRACGDSDVAVLAADARPAAGWLVRLSRALAADATVASATTWSNAGETAAFPRLGECAALPSNLDALARAAVDAGGAAVDLPAAVGHAVLLRGSMLRVAGGADAATYRSWYAALIDLSLRMAALGGRNVLCTQAYVARPVEGAPADGDLDRLAARWPHWNAALATFLMEDPLHAARAAMRAVLDRREAAFAMQPALFDGGAP